MNETAKPHLKVSTDIPAPSLEQLEEELKIVVDTNQAASLELEDFASRTERTRNSFKHAREYAREELRILREDYEKIAADIADCEETIAMYDRGLSGEREIIDG